MTKVVVDASAGVEIAAETTTGKALSRLVPPDAELWVPEHLFAECGAVLRKWDSVACCRPSSSRPPSSGCCACRCAESSCEGFRDAWRRHNFTFADALYVVLAVDLGAALLTGDHRLAAAPRMPVPVLHLSGHSRGCQLDRRASAAATTAAACSSPRSARWA